MFHLIPPIKIVENLLKVHQGILFMCYFANNKLDVEIES